MYILTFWAASALLVVLKLAGLATLIPWWGVTALFLTPFTLVGAFGLFGLWLWGWASEWDEVADSFWDGR